MGSQVIGEDRNRLPGRRTVREVRRGGRRANDKIKERVHRFMVKFRRKRRASRLPYLSLGLGNDRQGTSGSRDVSLTTFVVSISGSKNLASFTNRFFHFSRPPGLRLMLDAAEKNGKFGRLQCQRSKESSSSK